LNLHDATFALCSSVPSNAPDYNHRPQEQRKNKIKRTEAENYKESKHTTEKGKQ
jgi:hypothetical protein